MYTTGTKGTNLGGKCNYIVEVFEIATYQL